jgi:hypothetical protein
VTTLKDFFHKIFIKNYNKVVFGVCFAVVFNKGTSKERKKKRNSFSFVDRKEYPSLLFVSCSIFNAPLGILFGGGHGRICCERSVIAAGSYFRDDDHLKFKSLFENIPRFLCIVIILIMNNKNEFFFPSLMTLLDSEKETSVVPKSNEKHQVISYTKNVLKEMSAKFNV